MQVATEYIPRARQAASTLADMVPTQVTKKFKNIELF